ncbi:MAG TPA: glycosyltransferase family 39 protein [Candidatus Paceibacterota bacterium]
MTTFVKKNWVFVLIALIFVVSRLFALGQIYHQDEYKWATIVNPAFGLDLKSNHPPLVSVIYRAAGEIAGFENLRLVPIFFGLLVLILSSLVAKRLYGRRAALWTALILTVSAYNVIASTQVDIDGALLPFAGLLLVYSYYRIDFGNVRGRHNYRWFALVAIALALGLLIKLSFVIWIAALLTEYVIEHRPSRKTLSRAAGLIIFLFFFSACAAFAIIKIFHIADSADFVRYVSHFSTLNFTERNYGQVLFLSVKAAVLASPLLLVWYFLVFTKREHLRRYRLWIIFLLYNFLFYFVIFDFTNRTIERYLMFLIIPSALIAGSLIAGFTSSLSRKSLALSASIFSALTLGFSYLVSLKPHDILPLNPKSEYLSRIKDFNVDFLIPVTGGSGPAGFYVSVPLVLFASSIALVAIVAFRTLRNPTFKHQLLTLLIALGFAYNIVLSSEFLSGSLYGSVPRVASAVIGEAVRNENIKEVITYYDIGGYELGESKKYLRRFYTDPMFAKSTRSRLASYSGYYAVVDFPEIDKQSVIWKYLETCKTTYSAEDGRVKGYIFNCKNGDRSFFADNKTP